MQVCVVEDNATNLAVLVGLVSRLPGVTVEGFPDPVVALEACRRARVDLVLVDYLMPEMDGVAFIEAFRRLPDCAHTPIVMITSDQDRALRLRAIGAGATDFLTRPIDPQELKVRVSNLLELQRARLALADRALHLAAEVEKATAALARREEEVISRLARAIDLRDGATGDHVTRVATIAAIVAEELGCPPALVRDISLAAPLHDLGKLGVPDAILNKPGRLDADEIATMRRHPALGAALLEDGETDLLRIATEVARSHHERWDGLGYPYGLAGEAIPLPGRIVALADVFDALASVRPYKRAWSFEEARAEIRAGAGSQFDPACVAAFERGWHRIVSQFTAPAMSGAA